MTFFWGGSLLVVEERNQHVQHCIFVEHVITIKIEIFLQGFEIFKG
jgi:hypothetical protein